MRFRVMLLIPALTACSAPAATVPINCPDPTLDPRTGEIRLPGNVAEPLQSTQEACKSIAVTRGRSLYGADGRKVPLLYGLSPAWRSLALGMTDGVDVRHFSLATYSRHAAGSAALVCR